MKIVLRQEVPNLGESGTVQTVKDGFARNYLIPKGFAVMATPGELKTVENNQRVKDRKLAKQEQALQSLADKINGQRLEFTARAGEHGRLYGSITAGDIAERLTAVVREEIDRRRVVLDDPIRSLGEHTVTVHLVGRLRPQVTVTVVAEVDPDAEVAPAPTAKGRSGHPEPGSDHDDTKTETVADGPALSAIDGVPGADGDVVTRGGAQDEVSEIGPATEVADETDS